MGIAFQVMKISDHSSFSLEDQHRFWKKLHRSLEQSRIGWDRSHGMMWVDLLYKGSAPFEAYIALPQKIMQKVPYFLIGNGIRKRTHHLYLSPVLLEDLFIPSDLSVCELKLEYDNLFSLQTHSSIELPFSLPLDRGEMARISFCLVPVPVSEGGGNRPRLLKQKAESGTKSRRGNVDRSSFFCLLLYGLEQLFMKIFIRKQESTDSMLPYLTHDTLRKLNDQLFKAYVRIAAPQRHLPKLSRPFESLKGENQLTIHFLPKKEQRACLREINKQKLGLYSKSDLNPNVLGSRELSRLLPLFALPHSEKKQEASPKFL